jgi:acyl carrier protein
VVVVRDDDLIAYAVAKQAGYAVSHGERPTVEKLREYLAALLPEYMVPRSVMLLEALPLTANGKVDRAKLPSVEAESSTQEDAFLAPRTEMEQQLAAIWAEVLRKERIGVNENFLALGGHSLLAIRVLGKISKTFGVRLPLRLLFENATVEVLAGEIARLRG